LPRLRYEDSKFFNTLAKSEDIRGGKREWIIGTLIGFLTHYYCKLLRFTLHVPSELQIDDNTYIYSFWHNRVLCLPECFLRVTTRTRLTCLTSPSKDGTITEAMMAAYGVQSIRGSSSRRGKQAMIEMVKAVRSGASIAISPDGPRGPVYSMNPGVIRLAAKTQTPLIPVKLKCSRYWELKTWDKFRIPMPFSRLELEFCDPILPSSELSADEEKQIQLQCTALMCSDF